MIIAYSVIFALSLLLPIGYFPTVYKKQKELWLLFLFLCVCVTNLGWLLLSLSKTVEAALFANKLAYLGQIFILLCMLMLISKLCDITYPKWAVSVLIGVGVLMFAVVMTTGHLDWYYKSVTLAHADGAAKLVKEYGVLHPVYLIYVLAYFVAMLVLIGISLKKAKGETQKLAGLALVVVLGNIGMWLVEKLISWNFEFLAVSYLMSECVFFFVYWMMQDYIHIKHVQPSTIVVVDAADAEKTKELIDALPQGGALTAKEREVLERMLGGQSRKQMAAEMHVSENTVKTHVKHIYEKLGVSGREEILALLHTK